ncbi:MAG: MMPL family transporter [Mariprofundaceae bacterium]|nr:MMPL family transporter [Mariprofundaceae bacterium]
MSTWIESINKMRFLIFTAILIIVAVTAWQFPKVIIDTDPENMLAASEPVRISHHELKKDFKLSDLIVVGIVNEKHEKGVWQPDILARVAQLNKAILKIEGVVKVDVMGLSTSDTIEAGGGMLDIHTIMAKAPTTQAQADALKKSVLSNPLLVEKIGSADGQGLAIYVPIKDKMMSYQIATEIEALVADISGDNARESYHIAGLPVAEDTFGHDMFIQMAISAPMAGLVLMIMLWVFFRQGIFVAAPMIIAMVAVIVTMGTMIGMGYSIHIMSSMIPIFLMPIAVVDSVHILSEFYDHYRQTPDTKKVLKRVMAHLFKPMTYTSLTTMIGFGSLAFTPIPPVQIFGVFVALGIFISWLVTMLFIPAFLMSLNEEKLAAKIQKHRPAQQSSLGKALPKIGHWGLGRSKSIITIMLILFGASTYGISQIQINDNPVNWFKDGEKVRIADTVMNHHFAGTYMAFLRFNGEAEVMKEPEVATWIEGLQIELEKQDTVGTTSSYVDLVKRVNWAMHEEDNAWDVVPQSREEIAQYLFLFGMSGNPRDLDHFLDYSQGSSTLWMQLSSGDNQSMQAVENVAEMYMAQHPMPHGLSREWAGLTYINTVWQDKMVGGMLESLLGAFVMVSLLMLVLFRSIVWTLLAMLPLTVTIVFSYGFIGIIGKNYDMPVAVLSALALGLSIDFAIHFIARYRETRQRHANMDAAMQEMFGEPARALAKNALIVSIGFTPLLFAPLIPYVTVGVLLATIMALSWLTTILLLPALIRLFNIGEKTYQGKES